MRIEFGVWTQRGALVAVLSMAGCGGDAEEGPAAADTESPGPDTGVPLCVAGGTLECTCANGRPGVQDCGSNGFEAGPCRCDAVSDGCEGALFRQLPEDPGAAGPWPVGARTVVVDDLRFEVWYPAQPGSEGGQSSIDYDIREALPDAEAVKISDEDNPLQACDCYRDLPIDTRYGPYPLVVFIHGTAGFRSQSLPQMVHWASHGFVVMAADHPGLMLADLLSSVCGGEAPVRDLAGDVSLMLATARGEHPGLESLVEAIDGGRVGLAGHSAGGAAVGSMSDVGQVVIPMAAAGVEPGPALASVLILGGTDDAVVPYSSQLEGFDASPSPKRLVGIEGGGHLSFAQLCSLRNAEGLDLLTIARDNGVCGADLAGALFQCDPELIDDAAAWQIVNYASTAALSETLQCRDTSAAFDAMTSRFDGVHEFKSG